MQTGLFAYLSSLAQRCSLLAEKCSDPQIKEEIGAIRIELAQFADTVKLTHRKANRAEATMSSGPDKRTTPRQRV